MGRVALETIPSQHIYRSLRRLQARRARESQLLSLQLELGQVKFERDILATRDKEWWSWWNEWQQLQQQQQQFHMQMEEVEEEEEGDVGDVEDQGEDEAVQKNPSQVLPHDDLPQQLEEMQVRELALTQAMHELGKAKKQLETCLQEALLNKEEQDNRWKAKWARREKMMLESCEKQLNDQADEAADASESAATVAVKKSDQHIERIEQRYQKMLEKQSRHYEDILEQKDKDQEDILTYQEQLQEQEDMGTTKWDKREKMMLNNFEEQFEDQRITLTAEAKETIQKRIEKINQRCEQMMEKQSHRYEDMLDEPERRKDEQIVELQSIVADMTQDTPKHEPKHKKNKGTPG